MGESIAKAIKIDSLEDGALTSSMVDDCFFILKRCGTRAISASSAQCAQASISQVHLIELEVIMILKTSVQTVGIYNP